LLPLANIQGQYSEETILSVLHQTYKNIQYIVVDGGSSDQTMEVVNKYKDQIDIIIHEKDKGQIDVINIGFKLEKRELVGWINLMIFFFQFVFENC
jgi:glycosyltransferase involved in cell wall biosynthesis